eukprot:1394499-Amorphochlora_amoeboformis.AAC.1
MKNKHTTSAMVAPTITAPSSGQVSESDKLLNSLTLTSQQQQYRAKLGALGGDLTKITIERETTGRRVCPVMLKGVGWGVLVCMCGLDAL